MYNVLQTIAIRGDAVGMPDIITAVAMPGVVVLMVELFVSRVWIGTPWYMQAVRVTATVGIGGVAMRASWTHGHDWMLAHGHTPDVAIMWPLAIDLLAILATALILAGRRGQLATGQYFGEEMATRLDSALATGRSYWLEPDPVATQPLSADGQQLATEVATFLAADAPVSPAPATQVPRARGAKDEAVELYRAWDPQQLSAEDADALIMAYFSASERSARRWRAIARPRVS